MWWNWWETGWRGQRKGVWADPELLGPTQGWEKGRRSRGAEPAPAAPSPLAQGLARTWVWDITGRSAAENAEHRELPISCHSSCARDKALKSIMELPMESQNHLDWKRPFRTNHMTQPHSQPHTHRKEKGQTLPRHSALLLRVWRRHLNPWSQV